MRTLFIPPLTTALTLAETWQFDLYQEYRNDSLIDFLQIEKKPFDRLQIHKTLTAIPARSIVKVKRIYIRQGQTDYNSVTFALTHWAGDKIKGHGAIKFWAKLHDVNTMKIVDITEKKATPDEIIQTVPNP